MAPTIDDIVEILGNIQTQDAQNNDNLKSYFEEFKKVLEEKQNITSEKFDALQNNFNEILSRPSEASNTQELHDLFDNFQKHAGEIFDGINSQKALVDHFNQVIEQLSTNITDKEEIVSHIVELKNKINESSEAFATTNQYALNCIQDLNTNLNSIMLQDNNHEIRVQLENLANITNNTLATLKEFNQKTDTLADAIKNLINSDEYVKAWQKIYAISDTTSEIAARLSYLPLKSDTDEINQKIDTVKEDINNVVIQNSTEKFEKINNILSEMAQNLIEQQRNLYFENQNSENPDSYQAISEDIKKLEDTFNTNAQNYKVIIYETLTQIKSALDTQKDEVNGIISNSCGNNTVINDKLVNLESLSNGFKSSIEEILSGIQTVNQNLSAVDSSTVTNDDVKQEIETVKALSGNIVEMLNTFNTKNEEFEQTINSMVSSESYNTSVQKLDTLCAQGEELMVKISQLPAREEISDILNNISQDILKLSEDFTNQNNEYQTKIENIRSTIESYLNEIKDYADKQGYNVSQDFQDRLYSIENTLNTQASEQKEKIEKFNSEIENYMNLTNELANKSNEKFTTSSNEIAEIKNELQDISDIISSINANTEYKFSESVNYLDSNIQKVITNLEDMKATVEAGCNLTSLQGCLDSINYRFDEISNVLDTLKDSVTPDEEQPHDTITDLDDKLTTLKQEIDLVHTDIIDSVNNKYETIIKNIEVLKTDISEIIGYDFDKNFADLKAQIEMSFLSTGSDIKNASTEQQDAISSLEQVYKDIQNQITSVDESIKNNIPDRIELLRVTIENFTRNLEVNINKTSNFIDNWQNDLEEIKNFTTDVKTSLSKKLDAYTSEIKNQIINSDGTEKTLQVLDNLRASMESGIAEITNIQSDKVMELGSKIKDVVIEACENSLDRINSTIENVNALGTMTSDNDKIVSVIDNLKNILSNEISTKLQKYADEQNQQLEKIKADIDSYVYSEQIEDEKSKILDDINTIKETNQDNENILNIVSKLEKRVNDISAKNPANDYVKSVGENTRETILNELAKVKAELEFCLTESQSSLNDVNDKLDDIISSDDMIAQTLEALHSKVDVLAQDDDFDLTFELEDVKSLILSQIDELKTTTENEKTQKLDECLNQVLENINNIDKSSKDAKDDIISAIVSVFDQVSFVEETEEIKDFVEEKTDEINTKLKEVNDRLKIITTGESDVYTYTLQDVESDIAKLRLAMNDITDKSSTQALEDLRGNIDKVVDAVENMKSSLSQDQIYELKDDFTKLSQDMVSISSRTNKLLLTSDDSYKALSDGLDKFSGLIYQLENKIDFPDTTEISERIEKKVDALNIALSKSISNDQVFHQVLQYLGEWMDSVSESINGISARTSEISNVKEMLAELKTQVPNQSEILDQIGAKFEAQELRVDRLEMKLDNILTAVEDNTDSIVNKKLERLDKQMAKLALSVEKLTSYVDEE